MYIHVHTSTYIHVHTSTYQYVLVYTSTYHYQYISLHTSMYWHVPVYTSTLAYKYIPVYTGMYQYVLVYTGTYYYNLHCCSSAEGCCVCRTPLSCSLHILTASQKIWTKPIVLRRLVGAGGRTERDPMKCAVWFTSVPVRTCMYQYVPVCTMN
jgi:hypothetical protein